MTTEDVAHWLDELPMKMGQSALRSLENYYELSDKETLETTPLERFMTTSVWHFLAQSLPKSVYISVETNYSSIRQRLRQDKSFCALDFGNTLADLTVWQGGQPACIAEFKLGGLNGPHPGLRNDAERLHRLRAVADDVGARPRLLLVACSLVRQDREPSQTWTLAFERDARCKCICRGTSGLDFRRWNDTPVRYAAHVFELN